MNEPMVIRNLKTILDEDASNLQQSFMRTSSLTAENFRSIAINCVSGNPKLYDCDPLSIYRCILQTAQLGLNPSLKHVYFVPYKKTCTLIVGYHGLLQLIWSNAVVSSIDSSEVYEGDVYKITQGTSPSIMHEPTSEYRRQIKAQKSESKDRYGNTSMQYVQPEAWSHITDFYAWARLFSGDLAIHVMTRQEVDYVKDRYSQSPHSGPWFDSYIEMGKKTVIRKLVSVLPKSDGDAFKRLSHAMHIDRQGDDGGEQDLPMPVKYSSRCEQQSFIPPDVKIGQSVPPGHEAYRGRSINDPSIPMSTMEALRKSKEIDIANPLRSQFKEADEEFLSAVESQIQKRQMGV